MLGSYLSDKDAPPCLWILIFPQVLEDSQPDPSTFALPPVQRDRWASTGPAQSMFLCLSCQGQAEEQLSLWSFDSHWNSLELRKMFRYLTAKVTNTHSSFCRRWNRLRAGRLVTQVTQLVSGGARIGAQVSLSAKPTLLCNALHCFL